MSDTEERLNALEQTILNIQKKIDDFANQTDPTRDRLRASIDNLSKQLAMMNERRPRGYEPWSEEHEALTTHKYVAKEVMSNVLWRALRTAGNFFTGFRAVNELLDTMPAHTITKHQRFPPHGLYINIHNLDVYIMIQQLKEYAYRASAQGNQGGCTRQFDEILAKLQTLVVANVGSGRTVGMIHDRNSFEEEYKLKWVVDPGVEDLEEVGGKRDTHEGTVTGLSTSV